jgi:hypothetical protein
MTQTAENRIPNLWGFSDLGIDVLTPLEILQAQANHFNEMTKGFLIADISKFTDSGRSLAGLDIVAPELGNVRYKIITIENDIDMPYPVTLYYEEELVNPNKKYDPPTLPKKSLRFSESEVKKDVEAALTSNRTVAIIQSLLSKIREHKKAA